MSAAAAATVPGIGRRFGALVFDGVVFVSVFQGSLLFLNELVPSKFSVVMLPPVLTIWWLYASVTEGFLGKTVGKSLFGLEVRQLNGEKLNFNIAATRRLFDVVDLFLSFGLVGLILVLKGRYGQRLGDLVAGTRVVDSISR